MRGGLPGRRAPSQISVILGLMRRLSLILTLIIACAVPAAALLAGCSGDRSQADQLVQDGESLRQTAAGDFRQATLAMDGLVRDVDAGNPLKPDQTVSTTDDASQKLQAALDALAQRGDKLNQAAGLDLDRNYHQYLDQLQDNNSRLTDTMNAALAIPRLLKQKQYALAGWDQAKAAQVAGQVHQLEAQVGQQYSDADAVRNQAEQTRQDHPESFGG